MASSSEKDLDPAARRGFVPPRNEEETRLMRRVEELCVLAEARGIPRATGFLSDREQDLAQAALNRAGCTFGRFRGGWPGAERRVLCIEPPDAWPLEPLGFVHITWPPAGPAPGHRDLLGAILGLGLERTAVGDILLPPQGCEAWAAVLADKASLIASELTSAGRCPVRAEPCEALPPAALQAPEPVLHEATVPALRADAVLGAMLHISRAEAAALINTGRVCVNHLPLRSAHERVYAQDLFTVSGIGRCRLQAIGGKSRKDRVFIQYFQYE